MDRLRLIRTDNVGPLTFHRLLARFGSAEAALAALPELSRRGGRYQPIRPASREDAEREIEEYGAAGARVLVWAEADYPPLLAEIVDAPPVIAVIGDVQLLTRRMVAVVGTRNASLNGRRLAERITAGLGAAGLVVVSGLARGIDAAAHLAALGSGTVAVLAGGADVVYPEENRGLYQRIAAEGALISEMPPGLQPQARHFPRRNRLIAGLAEGVVVIEAALRSGSLITARLALDQGREVFAVPGSPLDPRSHGSNDLIRQGAILTESADDVIAALAGIHRSPGTPANTAPEEAAQPVASGASELTEARALIAEALSPAPATVDEIIRSCQLSPAVVTTVLLEWELAGRLERHPGNRVALLSQS